MTRDPFEANLAFACSLYPSVAEVCRKLGVNRQQFNKYLAGQVRPSRHNMRRICDFFGVTEWEMLMEENRFIELLSIRRTPVQGQDLAEPLRHIEALYANSTDLGRYVGYYYRYFYSFGYPGKIIKSLAVISEHKGRYFWKNLEFTPSGLPGSGRAASKYIGAAFYLGDRIYIIEYESLMAGSITSLTLYPSYHTRIDYLAGIQTGGPTKRGRKPAASFVLLEYLGQEIDIRRAFMRLGIFDEADIDERILNRIRNRIPESAFVFEAEQT